MTTSRATRFLAASRSLAHLLGATALVASAVLIGSAGPVEAAPYLANFEIDGNTTVQGGAGGGIDWLNVPGVQVVNDTNYTTGAGVQTTLDASGCLNAPATDTIHVNNDKFNNYPWPAPISGDGGGKTDICQGYIATEVRATPASIFTNPDHPGTTSDVYGYMGFYRRTGDGAASYWFELNQSTSLDGNGWSPKTTNDLMIGLTFPQNAGAAPALYYTRWIGTGWQDPVVLTAYSDFVAMDVSDNELFGEVALNISQLIPGCATFNKTTIHSFTAVLNSFQTGALADFSPATTLLTPITTCPNLTITKTAVATPLTPPATAAFDITVTNVGPIAARGFTLTDVLPTTGPITWSVTSVTGSVSPSLPTCSITAGTLTCGQTTAWGSGTPPLTATGADWGFILDTAETFTVRVTSSATINNTTANIPLANTATARAWNATDLSASATVVVLPRPRITLTKSVGGRVASGDQFTVAILNGASPVASGTTSGTGTTATTNQQIVDPGTYTLTDSAAGTTVLGQYNSTIACTNSTVGSTTVLPSGIGTSFNVAAQGGDVISCTYTNTPKPPRIVLQKQLGGQGRGNAADQFTLTVGGTGGSSATTSGAGTTVTGGTVTVAPATANSVYTFSEVMAAGSSSTLSQYTESISCTNARAGSSTVLPSG